MHIGQAIIKNINEKSEMKGVDLKTCKFTNLAFFANFPIVQNGKF